MGGKFYLLCCVLNCAFTCWCDVLLFSLVRCQAVMWCPSTSKRRRDGRSILAASETINSFSSRPTKWAVLLVCVEGGRYRMTQVGNGNPLPYNAFTNPNHLAIQFNANPLPTLYPWPIGLVPWNDWPFTNYFLFYNADPMPPFIFSFPVPQRGVQDWNQLLWHFCWHPAGQDGRKKPYAHQVSQHWHLWLNDTLSDDLSHCLPADTDFGSRPWMERNSQDIFVLTRRKRY